MNSRKWVQWLGNLLRRGTRAAGRDDGQAAANRVMRAVEQERGRIARELHDSVGQALYSVIVGLNIVRQLKVDHSIKEHFIQLERVTEKALEEVKTMAYELRPPALDDLGLVAALRAHLERYEYIFGIRTALIANAPERRYSEIMETALFRICQEALTNSAKYADTPNVEIRLEEKPSALVLTIKDFGRGISDDVLYTTRPEGVGLFSIRERAKQAGGKASIHSLPDRGTTIRVTVPI